MNIEIFTHADLSSLPLLQPPDWGDISIPLHFYCDSDFCFPIKVIKDNKMVGIGAAIIHGGVAWLGHIIVSPHYRNRGIGKIITQTLVDNCQSKNCETIYLIATDLGAPVYERIGFTTETNYLFFKDIAPGTFVSNTKNIVPFEEKRKEAIIDLDKKVSGEDRFLHLQEHIANSFLFIEADKLEGFYLPSFVEGHIIATTSTAGIELMKLRLMNHNHVVLPEDNLIAIDFLHQHNLRESKQAKRMILGKKRSWQPSCIYNRVAGNIG